MCSCSRAQPACDAGHKNARCRADRAKCGTFSRARIRSGDAQAFAQLFREHAQAVHAHAARWLGDPAGAEDVVSLTFLEAWRLRDRLLSDTEFAATDASKECTADGLRHWLFGIATNVLRNTRRAARRHRAAMERLPDRRADLDVVPDFSEALVNPQVRGGLSARRARHPPSPGRPARMRRPTTGRSRNARPRVSGTAA
ncbi:RNA polymerase sigma factor [Streptomyces sp. NPDC020845]|uniref:RNA polymerase sigma factor n=1 Tax=Streptomyces sp. NPDC020845 TaxID=3365096 RepID=UPI0037A51CC9